MSDELIVLFCRSKQSITWLMCLSIGLEIQQPSVKKNLRKIPFGCVLHSVFQVIKEYSMPSFQRLRIHSQPDNDVTSPHQGNT